MGKEYGVVVCTNCRNARTVDLSKKTTKCNYCGKRLKIEKLRIIHRTTSQEEAAEMIGEVNAKIRGGELLVMEEKEESIYSKAVKEGKNGNSERERLTIMARVLTEEMDSFDLDDIEKLQERSSFDSLDEMVEKFRKLDEVYEPERGRFKAIM